MLQPLVDANSYGGSCISIEKTRYFFEKWLSVAILVKLFVVDILDCVENSSFCIAIPLHRTDEVVSNILCVSINPV